MKAYEAGNPAYFATPPVNLMYAFHKSLNMITKSSPSLEQRFELHRQAREKVKAAVKELGLKEVALDPKFSANGMTAVCLSPSVASRSTDLIPAGLFPGWCKGIRRITTVGKEERRHSWRPTRRNKRYVYGDTSPWRKFDIYIPR